MAMTICANGHIYDPDQYAACPYCNTDMNEIHFGEGTKTTAPEGFSSPGKTTAPGNFGKEDAYRNSGIRPKTESPGDESGKTVAPDAYKKKKEEGNKTVAFFEHKHGFDPVTGWLVCVAGPLKGRDYRLLARKNSIGRSEDMDVCLREDRMISRQNHAMVAYDPRHNAFSLIPGEGTNTIYLNDEPVYIPQKLSAYDLIEMGETKMVFVPFCGERFTWPDA